MDRQILERLISTAKRQEPKIKNVNIDKRLGGYIEKYEKLRNIVGFHDEQAWRRYAIERIIKRQLFVSAREKPSAEVLLQELVLAHYITEEDVTEQAAGEIDALISKYILAVGLFSAYEGARKGDIRDWFFGIMAIEIEDALGLLDHEKVLVAAMESELKVRLHFPKYYLTLEQEEIFIHIGVCRTLLKADREYIAYLLAKRLYPKWFLKEEGTVEHIAPYLWNLKFHIAEYERHPLYKQLMRLSRIHAVIFLVLDEVLKKYHGHVDDLRPKLYTVVKEIHYSVQKKINRQVWHTFLFFFLTKLIFIAIIEVPYDLWQFDTIHTDHAIINLIFPVFLLLLLTVSVRVGTENDIKTTITEVEALVEGVPTKLPIDVTLPKVRSLGRSVLFNLLFLLVYLVSYGGIIYALLALHFTFAAGFLFVWFISLVPYLAMRIRFRAERFRITPRGVRMGREILYFFAAPLVSTGQWVMSKISRYNLFLIFFDLFLEAPYKTLIFLFRDFTDFAREKREILE